MALFEFVDDFLVDELMGRWGKESQGDCDWSNSKGHEEEGREDGKEGHLFGEGDDESDVEKHQLVEPAWDFGYFLKHDYIYYKYLREYSR